MTFSSDLDTLLGDFGVAVVWGGVSGVGVLDQPDQVIGDAVLSTEYSLLVKAATFAGLKARESVTVGGTAYTVRDFRKIDDGLLARVTLTKT